MTNQDRKWNDNYWLIWWNEDIRMGSLKSDSVGAVIPSEVPIGRDEVVSTVPPLVMNEEEAELTENEDEGPEICFNGSLTPVI